MATRRQRNVRDIFESSLESGEQREGRRRAEQQRAASIRSLAEGAMRRTTDEDSPHARGGGGGSLPSAGDMIQRSADLLGERGAPSGGGGIADMLQQLQQQQQARQEAIRNQLGSAYDQQIQAIRGQGPIMEGMAEEAQGNIGDFFDYAAESAERGREPVQQAYGAAGEGVEQAYGQATEQVRSTPTVYADLAEQAGGAGARSGVAERVSAAAAPFEQALSSGEAAVQGNLAQGQAAGESYLSQLASAAPSEAAMAQSGVEGALQQQLQDIQMQAAQLEGAKQKALMQASADTSGDAFDRMMDLQRLQMDKEAHEQEMQQGGAGGMDLREQLQTEQLMGEMTDPTRQQPQRGFDMFTQQAFGDHPGAQQAVQSLGNYLQSNWPVQNPDAPTGDQERVPAEQAIQSLMSRLENPGGELSGVFDREAYAEDPEGYLEDEEFDPRIALGHEAGVQNPALLGALNPNEVRRALQILAGVYQE